MNETERAQQLQWASSCPYGAVGHMEIAGRGLQICVTQQSLDDQQVDSFFQQVSGESVP